VCFVDMRFWSEIFDQNLTSSSVMAEFTQENIKYIFCDHPIKSVVLMLHLLNY